MMMYLHLVIMLLIVFGTAMFIGIFRSKETLTGYSFMAFILTALVYVGVFGFIVIDKLLG